ncbi:Fic family protein [Sphingorhabdus contaminans]|uniref:Fic family protein n=1 Tax=Sphingorhabdus contaminans TaxID=1343899 RepID=UPI003D27C6F1
MDLKDYVSGKVVEQYEYSSFQPMPIKHAWIFPDPALLALLSEADRAIGELNAFAQLVPDVDFFIRMHVAKEATQSSKIEGTQTNIEEAFYEERDIVPEQRDDWQEVQNYIHAINQAIERLKTLPLSNRLLRDTHHRLMQSVRGKDKMPGEFRVSRNWIGVSLKNAVFVPPHHDSVPELMSDLEKFLHDETHQVPHLIKIAIAHYQFETIHPFLDGNGRLGRLMIALYFASSGLLVKPALYLSDYFERNKTEYIDRLMAVRQGNHMDQWLVFFLHGVRETAQRSIGLFRSILELKERLEREVIPHFSTRKQANAQSLMRLLYQRPIVDVKQVSTSLKLNTNTTNSLMADFVTHGILREITGQRRNRLFAFDQYIKIFATDA